VSVLAIDAGTTGVTAVVVGVDGTILAQGYSEFEQHFVKPGWVEHDPEQIWQATLVAVRSALAEFAEFREFGEFGEKSSSLGQPSNQTEIVAIGITNQRETVPKVTILKPPTP
jgi:glycerol kinase